MVSAARGNQHRLGHEFCTSLILKNISVNSDGCWNWTRYLSSGGYGIVANDFWGKYYRVCSAHRYSYIIYKGDFNRKLWVLHTCHNRACVNPDHLYLGDAKQNTKDMLEAGRANGPKGSRNGKALLSESDVVTIKGMLQIGLQNVEIANIFNVNPVTVSNIKTGSRWGHLKPTWGQ